MDQTNSNIYKKKKIIYYSLMLFSVTLCNKMLCLFGGFSLFTAMYKIFEIYGKN